MQTRPVRVLSERIMSRGFEPTVVRLMEKVQKVVRVQPGLISLETLSDVNDHHKYVVLSEWKSLKDYKAWTSSKAHRECTEQIDEVLDVPGCIKKTWADRECTRVGHGLKTLLLKQMLDDDGVSDDAETIR